jgi:tRNA G18 (ribose-2'-O)-methylase SpoU
MSETQEPGCSTSSSTDHQADHNLPACYVIVYNVSKHSNVGTLLRSCTAFGVKAVREEEGSNHNSSSCRQQQQ